MFKFQVGDNVVFTDILRQKYISEWGHKDEFLEIIESNLDNVHEIVGRYSDTEPMNPPDDDAEIWYIVTIGGNDWEFLEEELEEYVEFKLGKELFLI